MALMSGKVYSNTGAPNNADGIDGDIYMQLDGFKTTYRKESGAWVAVGSTLGAIPEFISGVGVPSNSLGTDGQYYRNTAKQDIYYKQGGVWNIIGNLDNSSVSAKLSQAGIGKYLGTAPNVVTTGSMNDLVIAGEYYVTGSVTNMPPNVSAGYVKVWGLNSGNVAQTLQRTVGSSVFEIHFRQSSGGAFGAWRSLASTDLATTTLAGIVEKATQVELNTGVANVWPDAATLLSGFVQGSNYFKLPEWLGGWLIQFGYYETGDLPDDGQHVFTIPLPADYLTTPLPFVTGYSPTGGGNAFVANARSATINSITVVLQEFAAVGQGATAGVHWFTIGK
jgi:hypothetical protein